MAKTKKVKVVIQPKNNNKKKKSQRAVSAREVGLLGQALRSLGAAGGGAIGGYFGNPITGAAVGNSLGATISKWLGAGDYAVGSNSIVTKTLRGSNGIPMMHTANQSIIVRHKEYLGEVRSNTAFTVLNSLPINPGMSGTFPWLSDIAVRFQEYKLRGMVFHYVPSSGTAISGTNAALGTVMMQTSYRSTDAAPTSKIEMLNEYWSSESSPAEAFCHPIECDPKENPFSTQYVRSGPIPEGDSMLMYDVGTTHVAVSGNPATGNILGDLWVTYEVEFKKPVLVSNVAAQHLGATLVSAPTSFTPTPTNLFGGLSSTIGNFVMTSDGANTITFPRGLAGTFSMLLVVRSSGNWTQCDLVGAPTLTNCISVNTYPGNGISYERTTLAGTTPNLNCGFHYSVITILDPMRMASVKYGSGMAFVGATSNIYLTVAQVETRAS